MFRGLKDKFKYKSGKKFLTRELGRERVPPNRKAGINAIGVIADLDEFDHSEVFFELIEAFGLRPNAVKVIGYRRYYDKNSPYSTPVFSDKDLGWNGEIENSYVLEFLSRDYDLLINYFKEENLLMQLLSIKVRARLRIGFTGPDPAYNDLIFDSELSDYGLFKSELKKYLGVLKQ